MAPRAARVQFELPLQLVGFSATVPLERCRALNLSESGMYIQSPTPPAQGTVVQIQMDAAGQSLPFAEGIVVWRRAQQKDSPGGCGVRFVRFLNPRAHLLLRELISSRMRRPPAQENRRTPRVSLDDLPAPSEGTAPSAAFDATRPFGEVPPEFRRPFETPPKQSPGRIPTPEAPIPAVATAPMPNPFFPNPGATDPALRVDLADNEFDYEDVPEPSPVHRRFPFTPSKRQIAAAVVLGALVGAAGTTALLMRMKSSKDDGAAIPTIAATLRPEPVTPVTAGDEAETEADADEAEAVAANDDVAAPSETDGATRAEALTPLTEDERNQASLAAAARELADERQHADPGHGSAMPDTVAIPVDEAPALAAFALAPDEDGVKVRFPPGADSAVRAAFYLSNPPRLVIDLQGAVPKRPLLVKPIVGVEGVESLRIGRRNGGTRVVLDLTREPARREKRQDHEMFIPLR